MNVRSGAFVPAGPVDVAVVRFPTFAPAETLSSALASAVESGAVRVLDVLLVQRPEDGGKPVVVDVSTPEEASQLLGYAAHMPGLLGEGDATDVAELTAPGTCAVIIAWESVWAARLERELQAAGGVVPLHERIRADELVAAVQTITTRD